MSNRFERHAERLERMRAERAQHRVRVYPRDDIVRRDIKHGSLRFPAEGSVEWPLDQFTKRRIKDGTVRLETPGEKKAREEQRTKDRRPNARQSAASEAEAKPRS